MSRRPVRLLPHPRLSLTLLALWLLLNNTLAIGQILLGLVLALSIPFVLPGSTTPRLVLKRPLDLIAYIGLVLIDIIRANFTVARQVLGRNSTLKSRFLTVPLDVTHPIAISLFASTITLTPGTVSCELSNDQRFLTVHALHVENSEDEIAQLKTRYEARLLRMFSSGQLDRAHVSPGDRP
ncbi:MAG: Na+/H+ antiporter subunit E [Halothiobacillus sp.]